MCTSSRSPMRCRRGFDPAWMAQRVPRSRLIAQRRLCSVATGVLHSTNDGSDCVTNCMLRSDVGATSFVMPSSDFLCNSIAELWRRRCRCPSGCCTWTAACTRAVTRRQSITTTSSRTSRLLAGGARCTAAKNTTLTVKCLPSSRSASYHTPALNIAEAAAAEWFAQGCAHRAYRNARLACASAGQMRQSLAAALLFPCNLLPIWRFKARFAAACLMTSAQLHCRSPTEPRVHLLYRPGHYDILYPHQAAGTAGAQCDSRLPL